MVLLKKKETLEESQRVPTKVISTQIATKLDHTIKQEYLIKVCHACKISSF